MCTHTPWQQHAEHPFEAAQATQGSPHASPARAWARQPTATTSSPVRPLGRQARWLIQREVGRNAGGRRLVKGRRRVDGGPWVPIGAGSLHSSWQQGGIARLLEPAPPLQALCPCLVAWPLTLAAVPLAALSLGPGTSASDRYLAQATCAACGMLDWVCLAEMVFRYKTRMRALAAWRLGPPARSSGRRQRRHQKALSCHDAKEPAHAGAQPEIAPALGDAGRRPRAPPQALLLPCLCLSPANFG